MVSSSQPEDEEKVGLPVSPQWLEKILCQKVNADAKLLQTKCRAISKGKGFLSVITQAKLTWDIETEGTQLPASVVIKRPNLYRIDSLGDVFANVVDKKLLSELHNKECDAYAMLTAFEEKPPIPIPFCYYAEKMDDEHCGMLILEDFCDIARSLHFNDDLDLDQVFTIVECVARLQSYGFRHPSCQKLYDLKPLSINLYEVCMKNVTKVTKFIRETYPGELKYTDEQIQDLLGKAVDNIEKFRSLDTEYFTPAVCTGDCQINNLLWRLDKDGRQTGNLATIVDFQFFSMNNCLNDIMWDLVIAVDPEMRRRNIDAILSHYFTVVATNTDGKPPLTMEEIRRVYKQDLLQFGLTAICWTEMVHGMPPDHGMRCGRDKETLRRAIAAIDDALE